MGKRREPIHWDLTLRNGGGRPALLGDPGDGHTVYIIAEAGDSRHYTLRVIANYGPCPTSHGFVGVGPAMEAAEAHRLTIPTPKGD